jgi:hypothetical protein
MFDVILTAVSRAWFARAGTSEDQLMKSTLITVSLLMLGWSSQVQAQEPSGHLDLDMLAGFLRSELAIGRIVFFATDETCPQQLGTLRVGADGSMADLQALFGGSAKQYREGHTGVQDDHTYRHHVATETCQVDIDIREQVRRDGVWTSLLVPRSIRPSLSPEERSEAERESQDRPSRIPSEQFGRFVNARDLARRSEGTLRQGGVSMINLGINFEGERRCFEAVGDYLIDQRGVAFQFVTYLPGDMNRFLLDRVDVDKDHSRIYLTDGDCRIELTVGASILWHGQWVARSVAPYFPPKITIKPGGG